MKSKMDFLRNLKIIPFPFALSAARSAVYRRVKTNFVHGFDTFASQTLTTNGLSKIVIFGLGRSLIYKIIIFITFTVSLNPVRAFAIEWDKQKALDFIEKSWHQQHFQSLVSSSKTMKSCEFAPSEVFSTILIFDLLKQYDWCLKSEVINYVKTNIKDCTLHFFENPNILPADVDTTSLGLMALNGLIENNYLKQIVKRISENTNNGVIKVYFDNTSYRQEIVDPVVCANALYSIYSIDSLIDASVTENYLYNTLYNEEYQNGTRYYPSSFTFLWAVSKLLKLENMKSKFLDLLKEKILKIDPNLIEDSLDLAFYIIITTNINLPNIHEKKRLAEIQLADGSWPPYAFFKYGSQNKYFGSSQISTAFAICALQ